MSFSKEFQAAAMAEAASRATGLAAPYRAIAIAIATAVAAQAVHEGKLKVEKVSLWSAFKDALSVAATAEHSPSALRMGLEVACNEADVPGGSFRSYAGTVSSMAQDIADGTLTLADALAMPIVDARNRYKEVTPLQAAKTALLAAIADWTPEQVVLLAELANGAADDIGLEMVATVATANREAREAKVNATEPEGVAIAA